MGKKYYYKAMDKDMECRGVQFKVGETYVIESPKVKFYSSNVFHFCEKLEDIIKCFGSPTGRHFLIEVFGDVVTKGVESGANKIRIVREISKEEIEEHIQDKDSKNSKEFLALFSSNIKTLERLSKDKYWKIRRVVSENPNTPAYMLEKLAKDKDWRVREKVATHLNTPVYILETFVKDKELDVLSAVAKNPNAPVYLLEDFSKHEDVVVRQKVAENPNTPVYLLEKLAKDEELWVQHWVITNPNTPVYIVEELSKVEIDFLRERAKKRLKEITQ